MKFHAASKKKKIKPRDQESEGAMKLVHLFNTSIRELNIQSVEDDGLSGLSGDVLCFL
jgi:hypothetical protein